MIWILLAGLSGVAVVTVAAWARRSRARVDQEGETRRAANQLDIQERELLVKLRARQGKDEGEGP
jgi:hypothetical protein